MDKKELIELTNKLYKITLLFPKKEPLRYKMREVADEILDSFVSWEALRDSNPGNFAANWENRYKDSVFLLSKNLGILMVFFEVAKWQNWASYFDILEIEEEYDKIKSNFKKEIEDLGEQERRLIPLFGGDKTVSPFAEEKLKIDRGQASVVEKSGVLNSREEKILEVLEEKGRAQVWEIKELFPAVSKRTLRRDFEKLLKRGLIERMGERNNTFYKLNPR